jgi:hypothetical protein
MIFVEQLPVRRIVSAQPEVFAKNETIGKAARLL